MDLSKQKFDSKKEKNTYEINFSKSRRTIYFFPLFKFKATFPNNTITLFQTEYKMVIIESKITGLSVVFYLVISELYNFILLGIFQNFY